MIFFTARDAVDFITPTINGGVCDPGFALQRVNEATMRLLAHPKKPVHIQRVIRFFTKKDTIILPRGVERILYYTMDTRPVPLFSNAYEFVSHGPGELSCDGCSAGKYLESLGNHYPTMFELPVKEESEDNGPTYTGHKLVAFSTEEEDAGAVLTIFGAMSNGEEVGPVAARECRIPIQQWSDGNEGSVRETEEFPAISAYSLMEVTRVIKPVTRGYVTLLTYDRATHEINFLAKYHPTETQPRFHKYRITSPDYCCGTSIMANCELGYVPLSDLTDVLIIQNLQAIKAMSMAIDAENARDLENAVSYEANARRMLSDQRMGERTHDYNLIQVSPNFGFGGIRRP